MTIAGELVRRQFAAAVMPPWSPRAHVWLVPPPAVSVWRRSGVWPARHMPQDRKPPAKKIRGRGGTKQAAGCFTFGYSGEGIGPPHPNIGIDGRQTRPLRRGPRGGKAVAFGRASHRSLSIVRFATLNPSAGGSIMHGPWEGMASRAPPRARSVWDGLSTAKRSMRTSVAAAAWAPYGATLSRARPSIRRC